MRPSVATPPHVDSEAFVERAGAILLKLIGVVCQQKNDLEATCDLCHRVLGTRPKPTMRCRQDGMAHQQPCAKKMQPAVAAPTSSITSAEPLLPDPTKELADALEKALKKVKHVRSAIDDQEVIAECITKEESTRARHDHDQLAASQPKATAAASAAGVAVEPCSAAAETSTGDLGSGRTAPRHGLKTRSSQVVAAARQKLPVAAVRQGPTAGIAASAAAATMQEHPASKSSATLPSRVGPGRHASMQTRSRSGSSSNSGQQASRQLAAARGRGKVKAHRQLPVSAGRHLHSLTDVVAGPGGLPSGYGELSVKDRRLADETSSTTDDRCPAGGHVPQAEGDAVPAVMPSRLAALQQSRLQDKIPEDFRKAYRANIDLRRKASKMLASGNAVHSLVNEELLLLYYSNGGELPVSIAY